MDEQIVDKTAASAAAAAAAPAAAAAAKPNRDLSPEIEHAVDRDPHDRVKCVRLFDDFYRCNWWGAGDDESPSGRSAWTDIATSRVRKSRFLNVTLHEGKLRIKEVESSARA
jgi:hypothetical protein